MYHNWEGEGRTLTLPLSKECIEYGDRFGYDNLKVSQTGWHFAMSNKEGGTMIYKSFWDADSGVGNIIKIEWLNAQIESEIKKLKNQFTKVRVNHGANSKMTVALPKKLTEFGDRYGYDKITFARKGATFYLYDPDGFILLRKDCWETGLGEIKSMEWLNDKAEAVPFKPAPAPYDVPVDKPASNTAPVAVIEEDSPKVETEEKARLEKETEEEARRKKEAEEKARLEKEREKKTISTSKISTPEAITSTLLSEISYKDLVKKVFSFKGRIGRKEYVISFIIFFIVGGILNSLKLAEGLTNILYLALMWFFIAQNTKRCHDRGNSGWYQIIPFYVIYLLFAIGDNGTNKYGDNPTQ